MYNFKREDYCEDRSYIFLTLDVDRSSHELQNFFGDRKAEPASAAACKALILLFKNIKYFGEEFLIDSDARVRNDELQILSAIFLIVSFDSKFYLAGRLRIFYGVLQNSKQNLFDLNNISHINIRPRRRTPTSDR